MRKIRFRNKLRKCAQVHLASVDVQVSCSLSALQEHERCEGCGFHWQTYFRRLRVLAGRQFEQECCWSPDVLRKYWIWTSGGGEGLKAWSSVFGNMAGGGAVVLGAQRGPFFT